MCETPRTDPYKGQWDYVFVNGRSIFQEAQQLESELTAANARIAELEGLQSLIDSKENVLGSDWTPRMIIEDYIKLGQEFEKMPFSGECDGADSFSDVMRWMGYRMDEQSAELARLKAEGETVSTIRSFFVSAECRTLYVGATETLDKIRDLVFVAPTDQ